MMILIGLVALFTYFAWVIYVDKREKKKQRNKWVQIKSPGKTYSNYCNVSGCINQPLKEPINFWVCEDHQGEY